MLDYIKRLRLCIRWLQELEGDYAFEHEKLRNALELTEKKCADMGMVGLFVVCFDSCIWLFVD